MTASWQLEYDISESLTFNPAYMLSCLSASRFKYQWVWFSRYSTDRRVLWNCGGGSRYRGALMLYWQMGDCMRHYEVWGEVRWCRRARFHCSPWTPSMNVVCDTRQGQCVNCELYCHFLQRMTPNLRPRFIGHSVIIVTTWASMVRCCIPYSDRAQV